MELYTQKNRPNVVSVIYDRSKYLGFLKSGLRKDTGYLWGLSDHLFDIHQRRGPDEPAFAAIETPLDLREMMAQWAATRTTEDQTLSGAMADWLQENRDSLMAGMPLWVRNRYEVHIRYLYNRFNGVPGLTLASQIRHGGKDVSVVRRRATAEERIGTQTDSPSQ